DEVAADVLADDRDHLAYHRDPNVGRIALAHLDQLSRIAADGLVEAEEVEARVVVADLGDLEQAAGASRVVSEGRRAVESEVRGDDAVAACGVALGGRARYGGRFGRF